MEKHMNKFGVEITAPDISRWKEGNTGVDYVWQFDSGKPGPNVMVQALTHGNEICGAIVMDWFLAQGYKPEVGVLTLSFGNLAAFGRWDPDNPEISRYTDEDMNRVWADDYLNSDKSTYEVVRARQLLPFVEQADFLLDIHSMREPCAALMVCGVTDKGAAKAVDMSKRLGLPQYLMYDTGHPAGLRMIERPQFADPKTPKTAILIECGQHWEKSAVDVARETMLRFLVEMGTIHEETVKSFLNPSLHTTDFKVIEVTTAIVAQGDTFTFAEPYKGLEIIEKKGTVIAHNDGNPVLTPYDNTVLIMPAVAKQWKVGTTMVRLGRLISG